MPISFTLRPAAESDFEFIWNLRRVTMKSMIEAAYGWNEETQRLYARESLAGNIVMVKGEPSGVLTLADWGSELHLVWMGVVPTLQGKGLGRSLLEHARGEAEKRALPLTLQVLRNNPALALYEDFGFTIRGENGPHKVLMRLKV